MTAPRLIRLRDEDNVAIVLADIAPGETLDGGVTSAEAIPRGHKIALAPISKGDAIRKLGQTIGMASAHIVPGAHVHVHNIDASESPQAVATGSSAFPETPGRQGFSGYRRADGRVGTRNCIGVVATVNCSATVVREIVARSRAALPGDSRVDAIVPITHATGCGMASGGTGIRLLQRTLRGFIEHPNFAGVIVVGLGCEGNDLASLLEGIPTGGDERVRALSIQQTGGTRATIEEGCRQVAELAELANSAEREDVPVSALTLGLQCGGSDAFSAVTANPALGYAADLLVKAGGTVILAETPEIHGAEGLLLHRATSGDVADALKARIAWWQDYVARNDASLNNNPSPGNMAGGISTIYEKSLGAVAKGGTSPLEGVFDYGQRIDRHGFVFMDSPGYDPCSVTGEIASGATLVCFTTGRGSVFGAKPVPSVKLATNSAMAQHMMDDIDFDCGRILGGELDLAEAGRRIYDLLLDVASGTESASERNGLGDFEFVPWQIGAVL